MPPVAIPDPTTDQLDPGIPLGSDQVTSTDIDQGTQLAPAPPPAVPPLIMRGPQGQAPAPSGPPLQLLTPEQASQREMWRRLQYATADQPIAQTEAAVAAALRFQAQRQYQQDLAAGTAPAEALAKVAPLLFGGPKQGNLGQAASFIRATQRPQPKFTDVGGVLYRHNPDGSVTAVTGAKVPPPAKLDPVEQGFLKADLTKLKEIEDDPKFSLQNATGEDLRRRAHDIRNKITIQYRRRLPASAVPNQPAPVPAPTLTATSPGATPPAPVEAAPAAIPTVTSKEQYDRLPSGTVYIGKGGRRYRKP